MARILITGSAQGLGRAAAATLLDDGHQVVVHARDTSRAAALRDLADRGAAVVVGDLASARQTRSLADQVNQLGRMDAGHPQRRRLRRPRPQPQPGRTPAGTGGQHSRPLPTDRADPEARPADLPHQRHARQRRRQPPRPRSRRSSKAPTLRVRRLLACVQACVWGWSCRARSLVHDQPRGPLDMTGRSISEVSRGAVLSESQAAAPGRPRARPLRKYRKHWALCVSGGGLEPPRPIKGTSTSS